MQRENQQLRKTIDDLKNSGQRMIELEAENEQLQKASMEGKTTVFTLNEVRTDCNMVLVYSVYLYSSQTFHWWLYQAHRRRRVTLTALQNSTNSIMLKTGNEEKSSRIVYIIQALYWWVAGKSAMAGTQQKQLPALHVTWLLPRPQRCVRTTYFTYGYLLRFTQSVRNCSSFSLWKLII